jgi:hypothetical protein
MASFKLPTMNPKLTYYHVTVTIDGGSGWKLNFIVLFDVVHKYTLTN